MAKMKIFDQFIVGRIIEPTMRLALFQNANFEMFDCFPAGTGRKHDGTVVHLH